MYCSVPSPRVFCRTSLPTDRLAGGGGIMVMTVECGGIYEVDCGPHMYQLFRCVSENKLDKQEPNESCHSKL